MANISKIKLPNNAEYNIIDATALHSADISRENIGSASVGTAIPADDITAWTTNTPTTISYTARSIPNVTAAGTASVTNGVLIITNTTLGTAISADDITAYTAGTAASLSYTAKSIPNISVTSTSVVTDVG